MFPSCSPPTSPTTCRIGGYFSSIENQVTAPRSSMLMENVAMPKAFIMPRMASICACSCCGIDGMTPVITSKILL